MKKRFVSKLLINQFPLQRFFFVVVVFLFFFVVFSVNGVSVSGILCLLCLLYLLYLLYLFGGWSACFVCCCFLCLFSSHILFLLPFLPVFSLSKSVIHLKDVKEFAHIVVMKVLRKMAFVPSVLKRYFDFIFVGGEKGESQIIIIMIGL